MMRARSNAERLAQIYKTKRQQFDRASRKQMTRAVTALNNRADDYLRGGAQAGDYPFRVLSGNLSQSQGFDVPSDYEGVVFNTAAYAVVAHEGLGSHSAHGRRPFLEDAANDVKPGEMYMSGMVRMLLS